MDVLKGPEKIGEWIGRLVGTVLAALGTATRAYYDAVGNSLVAGLSIIAYCGLGASAIWVFSYAPAHNRINEQVAIAKTYENALKEQEVVSKGAKARVFELAAARTVPTGVQVEFMPVPDAKNLVVYWTADSDENDLYSAAISGTGKQTILIPPAEFGALWGTGRTVTLWLHQELTVPNLPLSRHPKQFPVTLP